MGINFTKPEVEKVAIAHDLLKKAQAEYIRINEMLKYGINKHCIFTIITNIITPKLSWAGFIDDDTEAN